MDPFVALFLTTVLGGSIVLCIVLFVTIFLCQVFGTVIDNDRETRSHIAKPKTDSITWSKVFHMTPIQVMWLTYNTCVCIDSFKLGRLVLIDSTGDGSVDRIESEKRGVFEERSENEALFEKADALFQKTLLQAEEIYARRESLRIAQRAIATI